MNLTKKVSNLFFFRFVSPVFGRLSIHNNKYVNVIYYHDIVQDEGFSFMRTNIDVFKKQMEWLIKEGYETLRFDDLDEESIKFRKGRIIIAFDDGWLSNYTEIFHYMLQRGLKYNIYLTIGEIGVNPNYLTWDMVREMHKSGLCGFGSHTFTHPNMSNLDIIDYQHEVNDANAMFLKELGYCPIDFCYPFGFYSEESNLRLEKDSYFARIYTSKKLYSYKQNGKIIFGRNGVSTDDSLAIFKQKVKGYSNIEFSYHNSVMKAVLNFYHCFHHPTKKNK